MSDEWNVRRAMEDLSRSRASNPPREIEFRRAGRPGEWRVPVGNRGAAIRGDQDGVGVSFTCAIL